MYLIEQAEAIELGADEQLSSIRRIGKRLFGMANCVISFDVAGHGVAAHERSLAAVEAAFCRSVQPLTEPRVVIDTLEDRLLATHRLVLGAPHIRFFASYPICNAERIAVGGISLIDYVPRVFDESDRCLLADLAHLIERELDLRLMSVAQMDLQKKNRNLRRKSLIDPLLGTWNRGAIMRILTIEAIRCDKLGVPLSLIVADLDFFKKINDTYGHPAGDAVLVRVASRLRSCIRSQEALGRYGGEEFLIVLPGSSHTTAMAVGERMRQAIAAQPETISDAAIRLTISAGVASTELFQAATTEELISRADAALYAAKDAGRNCVFPATVG